MHAQIYNFNEAYIHAVHIYTYTITVLVVYWFLTDTKGIFIYG